MLIWSSKAASNSASAFASSAVSFMSETRNSAAGTSKPVAGSKSTGKCPFTSRATLVPATSMVTGKAKPFALWTVMI